VRDNRKKAKANDTVGLPHDERAVAAFITTYTPLLRAQGLASGVDRSEVDTVVLGFLDEIVLALMDGRPSPHDIGGYLTVSFKRHVARLDTVRKREQSRAADIAIELSEASHQDCSLAIRNLCTLAAKRLSQADKQLAGFMGFHAAPRDVARWLGISHSAAKVRMHRARERIRAAMLAVLPTLSSADRRKIEMILERGRAQATLGENHPSSQEEYEEDQ